MPAFPSIDDLFAKCDVCQVKNTCARPVFALAYNNILDDYRFIADVLQMIIEYTDNFISPALVFMDNKFPVTYQELHQLVTDAQEITNRPQDYDREACSEFKDRTDLVDIIELESLAKGIRATWTKAYESCAHDDISYAHFAKELKECLLADISAGNKVAQNILTRLAVRKTNMVQGDESAVIYLKDDPNCSIDSDRITSYLTLVIINALGVDVMMASLDEGVSGAYL